MVAGWIAGSLTAKVIAGRKWSYQNLYLTPYLGQKQKTHSLLRSALEPGAVWISGLKL
jgi:hypothetical protein